jgi:succinate dehydrogenase / fumarate reductase flavoprotein subunit
MWDDVGMSRNAEGLKHALEEIPKVREAFWNDLKIPADPDTLNKNLEYAGRISDYLELGELMARDALERDESCGGHFREEHQTPEGEAERDDENYCHVAAWQYKGDGQDPVLHKEPLEFKDAKIKQRSYK